MAVVKVQAMASPVPPTTVALPTDFQRTIGHHRLHAVAKGSCGIPFLWLSADWRFD
jgi:hypothetical protein